MTEEAVEQIPAAEAPKEFRYEYQPKDEQGRPLGSKQVVVAASPEEAVEKIAQMHQESIKLNRKLNRDIRLGNFQTEQIPDNVPRVNPSDYEFSPKPLTAEERLQLVQDLNDPEKCDAAQRRLIEAQIGDPDKVRATLNQASQDIAAMRTQREAEAFLAETPDYYKCDTNKDTLLAWMVKNNLAPVKDNFKYAYDTLRKEGLMIDRPEAPPVVTPQVTPAPQVPEPPAARRNVPPVISRTNSSDVVPTVQPKYSAADIDKMTAEEYKQKIVIPELRAAKQANR